MRKRNAEFDEPLLRLTEQFAHAAAAMPWIERALRPSHRLGEGDGPRFAPRTPQKGDSPRRLREGLLTPIRQGEVGQMHFTQPSESELAALIDALARWRSVREQAELLRRQARKARAGVEVENRAVEVRLRAERTAGEILTHLARHGGDHRSAAHSKLTVSSVGISPKHSSVWRREAAISDLHFEDYLADAKRRGARLSTADLLRFGELTERRSARRKR